MKSLQRLKQISSSKLLHNLQTPTVEYLKVILLVKLQKAIQFQIPKSKCSNFFTGLNARGKSSFFQYVMLNSSCKVKSVILMEDLSSWQSFAPCVVLTKDHAIMSLKNNSALHAKFWKDKKAIDESRPAATEVETRAAYVSKSRYRSRKKIIKNLKKYSDKLLTGPWHCDSSMTMPKNSDLPYWMSITSSGISCMYSQKINGNLIF